MIESMLVADHGLAAAGVITRAQALGIKCVGIRLTQAAPGEPLTDASRLADDVVLLADLAELHDPVAVVRAAGSALVEAIHPGRGPLRSSGVLIEQARAAGLLPLVTREPGDAGEIGRRLRAATIPADIPADLAGDRTRADRRTDISYFVLATGPRIMILGSIEPGDVVVTPAGAATMRELDLVRAVAHVLDATGLYTVTIATVSIATVSIATASIGAGTDVGPGGTGRAVVGLDWGWPEHAAVWELGTGLDLLELQIAAETGSLTGAEPVANGVAVAGSGVDLVDDVRPLVHAVEPGLRLDTVPLAERGHGALVRASARGADRAAAEAILARYRDRLR